MSLAIRTRNFFSRIVGMPILCPKCEKEMVKTGFPKDGFQFYKCLDCGYNQRGEIDD